MTAQSDLPFGAADAPGAITCLGRTFPDEAARRAWYRAELRKHLADPAFRKQPGFPQGTDDAIVAMSDPPWYTACPNPWLGDFIAAHPRSDEPEVPYDRDALAIDVVEKKTGALYQAHGYHTKVPFLAILPFVLHYTKPGDVILDGFCGSGMAGVAAQWCASDDVKLRAEVEKRFREQGVDPPAWGARRAVLNDLAPAATFIAANYNLPFDIDAFERAARALLDEVEQEIGWMYETRHADGRMGRIEYTVWSEVFQCPSCGAEVVFTEEALDEDTQRVRESFPCPSCKTELDKGTLERVFETNRDGALGIDVQTIKFRPHIIKYTFDDAEYSKKPDEGDLEILKKIRELPFPVGVPTVRFPLETMSHGSRLKPKGFTHVHQLFLPRARQALALLWTKANAQADERTRLILRFTVEQAVWGMSVLNRYKTIMHGKTESSNVNQYLSGVYYVPSQHSEVSPRYNLENRIGRMAKAFRSMPSVLGNIITTTGTSAAISLPDASIDYIFTDPPFGENIYYADLNFLVESFHGVVTDAGPEAIIDRAKKKTLFEYQELMTAAFREYYRVLKPGRWITVEFHCQHNYVWHAIQDAMTEAGFIVAAVRSFDKAQRSYRQVTSDTVKLDLLVTAYRPVETLDVERRLREGDMGLFWDQVEAHLRRVPIAQSVRGESLDVIEERTAHKLFDQMVGFYVSRGELVPLSFTTFRAELGQRYSLHDGMYFLKEQVPDYQRALLRAGAVNQRSIAPVDESSTIEWLRWELARKPQRASDLTATFMKSNTGWRKHESRVELSEVLKDNFLKYTGGPVPNSIWTSLGKSAASRSKMEGATPEAPPVALEQDIMDFWYVPDPDSERELAEWRRNRLLKEFDAYLTNAKSIRQFRTEALRAGFEQAWKEKSFAAVVDVGRRIPDETLAEDPRLLKLYNMARSKVGAP
jgi:hypothetical protein